MAIGFAVTYLLERAPVLDGLVNEDHYRPVMSNTYMYESFEDAFKKFVEEYEVHNQWYPDYIYDGEVNNVIIRFVHGPKEGKDESFRASLQIVKGFYHRKADRAN